MDIEIRELKRADHKKLIDYAIKGMHFALYFEENSPLIKMYGKYFWYDELLKATQIITAYDDEHVVGVLLARITGEKKKYRSFFKSLYVKFFLFLEKIIEGAGEDSYNQANKEMLSSYTQNNSVDGEITFLACDVECQGKGIGSLLLRELQNREKGKNIYLYTDDQCTYQFYEHKGFNMVGERDIVVDTKVRQVPLKCFLYQKIM